MEITRERELKLFNLVTYHRKKYHIIHNLKVFNKFFLFMSSFLSIYRTFFVLCVSAQLKPRKSNTENHKIGSIEMSVLLLIHIVMQAKSHLMLKNPFGKQFNWKIFFARLFLCFYIFYLIFDSMITHII